MNTAALLPETGTAQPEMISTETEYRAPEKAPNGLYKTLEQMSTLGIPKPVRTSYKIFSVDCLLLGASMGKRRSKGHLTFSWNNDIDK